MALSTTDLNKLSWRLRLRLLDMIYLNGGHFGGPLSSLDLLVSLYFSDVFQFKSDDKFVLSAGHLAPALYVVLSQAGYFPPSGLEKFSHFKSPLQGHVSLLTPGVTYASGLLGQGLSFASGLALANLLDNKSNYTVCLTTDGEHQEGQIWEAVMFANKYKLSHLINIVDYNKYQIDGPLQEIMPLGDLAQKYVSFGWSVKEVNGHDYAKIIKLLSLSKKSNYPTCIIAHTTFAKGISFAENNYHYHDIKKLDLNLYQLAKNDLTKHLN